MKSIEELKKLFKTYLGWNKARIDFLAKLMRALFTVRTVNLVELSQAFSSQAKPQSSYKRLQRFFRHFDFNVDDFAALALRLFIPHIGGYYVSMDVTHWDVGKRTVKILMLALVYRGVALPLYWKMLSNSPYAADFKSRNSLSII